LAAEGNHEEYAQPAAEEGEGEDAGGLEVEAEENERGKCEDDAGRDGLAGVAGGLDDVVLEDAGAAEGSKDGDGEDRDRDAGGNRKSSAESDIDRDRAEQDSEDSTEGEGSEGELRACLGGGNEGPEGGLRRCGGGHAGRTLP